TREGAEANVLDVQVIKEAVEHKIDKEKISIFRFNIDREWIPDELETPWGEFGIMLVLWSISTVILWLVFHKVVLVIARKTKTNLDFKIFTIIRVPFFTILLLYGLLVSLARVVNDDLTDAMYNIYISGLIIMVTYALARVFKLIVSDYLMELAKKTETEADDALLPLLSKMGTGLIWVVGVVMFLDTLGLDITVFVMGMGVVGLVVAFAAQDTMSNLFSGIMILIDRPFKEGDWIQLDDNVYQVVDIGLRSTRMFHSITNQMVTIPNSKISDHMFSNLNLPDTKGRTTVKVGVGYGSDPRKVGRILLEIGRNHPDTFEDGEHQPFYRFSSFGDSSLDFSMTLWVKDFNDQWRVASEVKEMIFYRFAREGIEIPFPQRVVHHMGEGPVPEVKKDTRAPSPDMKNLAP
ncbi:MAG: mechanosensitive ion channel family protein, partial [Thermoplasmata archaeon]|nr:mechanosensitive ion channel family protein [Thermoplasmata archaeon]